MSKLIEITVGPKGETRVETREFAGPECRLASQFVEQALGQKTAEKVTAEYYQQGGGADDAYVTKLYRDILGRDPNQDELRYWVGQLHALRGQREPFVAQFLAGTQRPVAQALCDQLTRDTRLLLDRARVELGNTARARNRLSTTSATAAARADSHAGASTGGTSSRAILTTSMRSTS